MPTVHVAGGMGLYFDEQVDHNIAAALSHQGINVLTVQDDGMAGRSDNDVIDRAKMLNRMVVTHDEDFLVIAAERTARGDQFAGVIFLPPGRLTIRCAISDLALYWTCWPPWRVRQSGDVFTLVTGYTCFDQ